ncbi:hypothetical protein HDU87_003496 [Geranomyces variabilis]|uniref:Co-chaperone HscB C-terminal oligomerisation domain-containing protein n=1 Tax=Geranomyces variabilis TaxID=109894 RepID=A0AAD5TKW2_9FUNG|nr:hypothetical protein HDU87_003496 [Geranomyces variabilis]
MSLSPLSSSPLSATCHVARRMLISATVPAARSGSCGRPRCNRRAFHPARPPAAAAPTPRRPLSTTTTAASSSPASPANPSVSSASTPKRTCWSCGAPIPRSAVFCPADNKLQPTFPESTYHDVLLPNTPHAEIPYAFDVDLRALRAAFLALQTRVHPDGFARASPTEKACADMQSSFINKGYQVLREPLSRAVYLLGMHGKVVGEKDGVADPELLMDVMESREALEDAQDEAEIQELKKQNSARVEETIKGISEAFRRKDIDRAKSLTVQLRYWQNIQKAADDWAPGKRVELEH